MAVLNHKDYRSAKVRLAQIQGALGPDGVVDDLKSKLSADVAPARRDALRAEGQRLQEEIAAYEKLQASQSGEDIATDDLGILPILGRIARRLSQRELGDRLGISEQQVQRYESDRYSSIGLARYKQVLSVLGIDLQSKLATSWPNRDADPAYPNPRLEIDPPLISEIRKRKWVDLPRGIDTEAAGQILATYVAEGAELSRTRTLHRRSIRQSEALNLAALSVWQARALQQAMQIRQKTKGKFNIVDTGWLVQLAKLSSRDDGPLHAVELLREHGIVFAVVPQLPRCRLDGAAILLADGTPAVVLTLRYNRLDSFWFTLFHELGHIFLHFNHGLDLGFIDNLDASGADKLERDADLFAQSALIAEHSWEASPARFSKSSEIVRKFAQSLGIHPSIVAGRIRKERSDYTIFNDLVGNGELHRQFATDLA
jgi:HTH-type transcriptional regulator/antitoxin HigA